MSHVMADVPRWNFGTIAMECVATRVCSLALTSEDVEKIMNNAIDGARRGERSFFYSAIDRPQTQTCESEGLSLNPPSISSKRNVRNCY